MRRGDVDIKRPELPPEGTSTNGGYPGALILSFVKMKLMQVSMIEVIFVRHVVYSHYFSVFLLIIFIYEIVLFCLRLQVFSLSSWKSSFFV